MQKTGKTNSQSRSVIGYTAVASLALLLGSCTLVADFEDYGGGLPQCEEGDADTTRDLVMLLEGMEVHRGDLVEVTVVTENKYVVARAVLDPLPRESYTLVMRGALEAGNQSIDLFADLSGEGRYDPPPTDHAWRLDPCASGVHRFTHNTNFTDIDDPQKTLAGGDFVMHFRDWTPHIGQMLAVYVIDKPTNRVVGFYRKSDPDQAEFTIALPGIIEQNTPYVIAVFADKNNNLLYDPPDEDHAWRIEETGSATGISFEFAHNTNFADIAEDIAPIGGTL